MKINFNAVNPRTVAFLASTDAIALARVFDNEVKPGWKLDADGKIELKDGNPVFITSDGKEMVVESMTVSRINGENKSLRERAEKAEAAAKAFDGLDVDAAKKAIETVSKLDAKQLIEAGKVDEVKQQITAQFQAQLDDANKKIADRDTKLNNMTLGSAFANSKFVQDRISVPVEMFQNTFANRFKVEDGNITPLDAAGNPLLSKTRIGEVANFDEAVEIFVDNYAHKDSILRAPDANGSGNNGGGGNRGGGRFITMGDFQKLNPAQQAEAAKKAGSGELTITD